MTPQQIEALKLALEALEGMQNAIYNIGGEHVIDLNYAVEKADVAEQTITAIKQALAEHAMRETQRLGQEIEQCQCTECQIKPHASDCAVHSEPAYPKGKCDCGAQPEQEPVMILPDGSAFGVMSFPLPDDHWLYAPNEYKDGEYEPIDLPKPILTHELRDAVVAAVRYAVRGATMRGQETDFDPDALVQNAVYALCGPYATPPKPKPEQEPVAWVVYSSAENDIVWADKGKRLKQNTPLYTTPPQRKPLTDEQIEQLEQDTCAMEFPETVRAIEASHGIKE